MPPSPSQRDDKQKIIERLEAFDKFMSLQARQAQNEKQRIELDSKRIEYNYKLANKSLDIQAKYFEREYPQKRKNLIYIAGTAIIILLTLLSFVAFIIYLGYEDVAREIVHWGSYVLVAFASYLAGKKSKSKKETGINEEDETLE